MTLMVVDQRGHGVAQPWTLDRTGRRIPGAESEQRREAIACGLARAGCTRRLARSSDDTLDAVIARVHRREYLDFLRSWSLRLADDEFYVPDERTAPGVPQDTPLWRGVFAFAREGARVALDAAEAVAGGMRHVYALCRPPGHHAGPDWYGGYCFLNNAAVAVEALVQSGFRPGVLDLDMHLGNGTAAILADRTDCVYASIHATTRRHYPWRDDLPGVAPEWCVPLDAPPSAATYLDTVATLIERLSLDRVDVLVISLGYDTVGGDPHGGWPLHPADLGPVAAATAGNGWPICVVQEGGYHLSALAECAESFARGLVTGAHPRRATTSCMSSTAFETGSMRSIPRSPSG